MVDNQTLGILMMVCMVAIIFVGFPISFTLLFISLVFGTIGLGVNSTFFLMYFQFWGLMKDDILPAVPLFVFMGYMTEQAGLMERLFAATRNLFAPLRGSLYVAVIITATIFAMATGIVGAAVTVLGIMAGSIMARSGYDPKLSAGAIAAGGTLGILIPPSVMLIVLGPTIGVPVNLLYAGAMGPGFLLAASYILYALVRSYINPELGPPVPMAERITSWRILLKELVVGIVPVACLIGFTLGFILAGLATATEAAACGAFGAMVLALAYGRLNLTAMKNAALATMLTTAMVMILAASSKIFGAIFTQLGAATLVTDAVTGLPLPDIGKLMIVLLIIFILGWPFEWPAIILVFVPIFVPLVLELDLGLNRAEVLLWFGILVAVNLQTAFLTPPVAASAFYLKNVMPGWSLFMIYKGMVQFIAIQVACIILLLMWPVLALWLPRVLY